MQIQETWAAQRARFPFRLGVLTNEISEDLGRALEVAAKIGIRDIELNSVWGQPATTLSEAQVARLKGLLDDRGARVILVLSSAFKSAPLDAVAPAGSADSVAYKDHLEELRRGIALAKRVGSPFVRVFAFRRPSDGIEVGTPGWRPSPAPSEADLDVIARGLRPALALARDEGVEPLLENVRYCYADTGAHTRSILEALGADAPRVIWDPANAHVSGEARAYPDGYVSVRSAVGHVHLKDARFTDRATGATEWERIGAGEVDLAGQIAALAADGFRGVASLETHWRLAGDTGERSTLATWQGLADILRGAPA